MNAKQLAAEQAVTHLEHDMIVGLGTGTTAYHAIQGIAARVKEGLRIRTVASSKQSEELAQQLGIPTVPFASIDGIDLTIDGADEVDESLHLIKGGGGALLREKILASNSAKLIIIVDESKLVRKLGQFPLPVEITPFAYELTMKQVRSLGCNPVLRVAEGKTFVTDNGNFILDCAFGVIDHPAELSVKLLAIPGVAEHGLFVNMADTVIIGSSEGTVRYLQR
ncbi:ribose-5-phosphate isomerase RpiA [Paenibacillus sacheonensis]|uniref:Ribose-5-phosphate isomerase A n=1 Tax=Paenibacillus sacheonensis TaxID=742054 RepID=A0A7X5BWJ8_9BACL|nr:ribose-5-phosphate isomerase RpiA [Paenibacillus sacheonensis]MBM7565553.1 ribose 5-phosphate isomerase A [Paenibacillus sacheonensis]NBC69528.1 ribose-5-phosphate isomerase RpiA [Paenibacillus sacheonensis]